MLAIGEQHASVTVLRRIFSKALRSKLDLAPTDAVKQRSLDDFAPSKRFAETRAAARHQEIRHELDAARRDALRRLPVRGCRTGRR
jgi:hypothetical protein